ncbi:MAG: SRPBCC family protein [Acidimicrobiales bacterium]
MKLENRFTVPVTADMAWHVLLDVERIAPCMPGATLTGRDGDSFTGTVKVKVGPINLTYGGTASFVSLDEAAHVAVIEASGKETRGTGTAKATITCRMRETGPETEVEVETDLAITGKPAQFGRGVLADVSAKLVTQFATCLAEEISPNTPVAEGPAAESSARAGGTERTPPLVSGSRPSVEAIDLLGTAGMPIVERIAPVVAGLALIVVVIMLRRRH